MEAPTGIEPMSTDLQKLACQITNCIHFWKQTYAKECGQKNRSKVQRLNPQLSSEKTVEKEKPQHLNQIIFSTLIFALKNELDLILGKQLPPALTHGSQHLTRFYFKTLCLRPQSRHIPMLQTLFDRGIFPFLHAILHWFNVAQSSVFRDIGWWQNQLWWSERSQLILIALAQCPTANNLKYSGSEVRIFIDRDLIGSRHLICLSDTN